MLKLLTTRSVAMFAVLDLLFSPLVIFAYLGMFGVESGGGPYLLLGGMSLLKGVLWASFLVREFRPYEGFARTRPAKRSADLIVKADQCLQSAPRRFGLFYACCWGLTYGAGFGLLRWLGFSGTISSPATLNAALIVCVAVFFGGFAFAFPLITALTAGPASECAAAAREHDVNLDRGPSSLRWRIGVIAISLGLGPTLWMVALGYATQLESSMERRALRAEAAAAELALAAREQSAPPGQQAPKLARSGKGASQGHVAAAIIDLEGKPAPSTAGFAIDDALARRIKEAVARSPSGVLNNTKEEAATAYRRIDANHVAVATIHAPAQASGAFVTSSALFALLVAVWAPVCAVVLGGAVSAPIDRLNAVARRVVEVGDLSRMGALPTARRDEVGVLTESFNDMLDMMRQLGVAAHGIAQGDLRVRVSGSGELPDAFRSMLENLHGIVRQIRETSVDLASAAAEILAASQEQEAAATSQSSAMTEISRTMDSLSESAAHVSDAVQGVFANAERTLQNTDDMVQRITELSSHASRIGEILEVIREIAERSDLLALNGSLEASRAGDGGRGFGLVAGEMRRLAERVTASTEDVKRLVADIRESGASSVVATEESKKLAESTTDAARQITFVTQQQRSGTEQVSQSVKGIAEVVTQAVSATAQTRTSAQGLKTQADRLAGLVRRFEVIASEAA